MLRKNNEQYKNWILDLVYYIKDKITTEDEIETFLKNYIENDQLFV